jgi:tetratricopeptide (TPR) repeat protein
MKRLLSLLTAVLILPSCGSFLGLGKGQKRELPEVVSSPPPKLSPKEKAQGYYQIAVAYLNLGEIPLALNYLYKAKKLEPNNPDIYNALGLAFLKRGDLKRAEENLRRALELKPNFSEAWLNLGLLYEEKGNLKKARECYEKALSNPLYLTPEVAYYHLALLDLKENNLEGAKRNLSLAIRNNPDYAPAYVELAKILEKEGRYREAQDIYFRLINLFPNLQYPYCALGKLYLKLGDRENGVKFLKKCVQIDPSSELAADATRRLEELNE